MFPNKFQQNIIKQQCIFQRKAWNFLIKRGNPLYFQTLKKQRKNFPSQSELEKTLKNVFLETEEPWCGYRVIRGVVKKFQESWEDYLTVKNRGFPTYHQYNSAYSNCFIFNPQSQIIDSTFSLQTKQVKGYGNMAKRVKIKDKGIIKFCNKYAPIINSYTLMIKDNKYYVCFSFTIANNFEIIKSKEKEIALDWGVKNLFTDNFGCCYNFPSEYYQLDKKIKRLRILLKRKQENSNNYIKIQKKIDKIATKIKNMRMYFFHNFAKYLLVNYDRIYLEDLNAKALINKGTPYMIHKMILHSFSDFKQILLQKSKQYTAEVILVNQLQYPTTQICYKCGKRAKRSLSQRVVNCPFCDNKDMDRDVNAAINLINFGRIVARGEPNQKEVH